MTQEFVAGSNLPPAGYKRDEELKMRTDNLEAQAETQYANAGSIPADALKPDPNMQYEIRKSHMGIGTDNPLYKTKWVNYVNNNGYMVWQAKSEGWNVATAREFPEGRDMMKSDGSLRVGDVLLMFMRIDEYLKLEMREKHKRLQQQYGVEADIHDLAERTNRATGQQVFTNIQTPAITGINDNTLEAMKKRSAQRTAVNILGNRMKEGFIPGVPLR